MTSKITELFWKALLIIAFVAMFSVTTAASLAAVGVDAFGVSIGIFTEVLPGIGSAIEEGQNAVSGTEGGN